METMKKITKIHIPDGALCPSAETIDDYRSNMWEMSPNVGYWVAGDLIGEISVGQPVRMFRKIRNGVECSGMFQTSPVSEKVVEIDNQGERVIAFVTGNSYYKIQDYVESSSDIGDMGSGLNI